MGALILLTANLAHVAGHLLAARLTGTRLSRVSLGLGPTLWERPGKRFDFRIAVVPIGFFVRLRPRWSRKDPSCWPPQREDELRAKGPVARLVVILAAPLMLFFLAYGAAFYQSSVPSPVASGTAVAVVSGTPAHTAGIKNGDRIERIDGQRVKTWLEIVQRVRASNADTLQVEVRRQGKPLRFVVRPQRESGAPRLGVRSTHELVPPPAVGARFAVAGGLMVKQWQTALRGLGVILGGRQVQTVGGPVVIVRQLPGDGKLAEPLARHRAAALWTIALCAYLLFCLFPLAPYLDGRRLLFWLIELPLRRPLHPRWEQLFNRVMLALLALLVTLALFQDVRRLWLS